MSRLLYIFERDMPTVSITREVFTHLKNYPEIKTDFMYLSDVKPIDIDDHDVIIFIRPDNIYAWKIAKEARKAGHVVVTFCDDDLLNLPSTTPTIPWRKKGLLKCLAHSDVIWSSSKYISTKYQNLTAGKRTAIIDTIVRPEELEGIDLDRSRDGVRIVYAAAPSHADLFEKYIGPIIPNLVKEFGDKISFTFVSVRPKVEGIRHEYISGMPLLEYRKFMKEQGFDIGLAPLHDDEFSKCKYFNKFLEYTSQGIMGIYSNTEPYTYVVRNGETGLLAENNSESWFELLSDAISNQQLRKRCVINAIDYIRKCHSETACIEKICQGLPEILETNDQYRKCCGFRTQILKYFFTRPFDWLYLTMFFLKNSGVKTVVNKARRHFIDNKAYSRRIGG